MVISILSIMTFPENAGLIPSYLFGHNLLASLPLPDSTLFVNPNIHIVFLIYVKCLKPRPLYIGAWWTCMSYHLCNNPYSSHIVTDLLLIFLSIPLPCFIANLFTMVQFGLWCMLLISIFTLTEYIFLLVGTIEIHIDSV